MSRYLAEALDNRSYTLSKQIADLEKNSGHPNHDLRLTSEIHQAIKSCLEYLGLDPVDTTQPELYHALNQKLIEDDAKLVKKIRSMAANQVNAAANVSDGLNILLKKLDIHQKCFTLKTSSFKKLIKDQPPKKVMKELSYRSVDSLIKYEPMALIVLAINKFESQSYIDHFYLKYKSFELKDFEVRELTIYQPSKVKWLNILSQIEKSKGYKLISCSELASIILMPQNNILKEGELTAHLVDILNEVSKIIATSNYLKLHQFNKDISNKLYEIAEHEPMVSVSTIPQLLPWRLAQTVIRSSLDYLDMPVFTEEAITFNKLLHKLAEEIDDFKFWQTSEFLGLVDKGETTSFNIIDVATNLTAKINFESRKVSCFRERLWHELVSRYLNPQSILEIQTTGNNSTLSFQTAEY